MDANNTILLNGGEFGSEETRPFERVGDEVLNADFIADATAIYEGDMITFSDISTGGTATNWYWEFEGGNPATSSEQNPVVTYMTEGVYDVTLSAWNSSSSSTLTKEDYITVDVPVGTNYPFESKISIFPNPTSGKVNISGIANADVKVYNTTGEVIFNINIMKSGQIDLSGFENGIYFINIKTDDGDIINHKVSVLK
jgi:PKD repeat protein